jgi:hypothetical protein
MWRQIMKFSSSKKYLKYGCTFVSIIHASRTNPLCSRLVLPSFARLSRKQHDFRKKMFFTCGVSWFGTFTNQEDSSMKYELGRSSGNVCFFLFYPNLNTLDACLQYRLSRKSYHWDRHMTRQIVFSQLRERARKKENYVWSCSICNKCDETDVL